MVTDLDKKPPVTNTSHQNTFEEQAADFKSRWRWWPIIYAMQTQADTKKSFLGVDTSLTGHFNTNRAICKEELCFTVNHTNCGFGNAQETVSAKVIKSLMFLWGKCTHCSGKIETFLHLQLDEVSKPKSLWIFKVSFLKRGLNLTYIFITLFDWRSVEWAHGWRSTFPCKVLQSI